MTKSEEKNEIAKIASRLIEDIRATCLAENKKELQQSKDTSKQNKPSSCQSASN